MRPPAAAAAAAAAAPARVGRQPAQAGAHAQAEARQHPPQRPPMVRQNAFRGQALGDRMNMNIRRYPLRIRHAPERLVYY